MRVWLVFVFLMLVMLAGCLSKRPDATTPAKTTTSTTQPLPSHVAVYGGNASRPRPPPPAITATIDVVHTGEQGPEPNIGVTKSGAVFATAGSQIVRSKDQGRNWAVVHTHLLLNNDPMMAVDHNTDRVYNAPMSLALACSSIYWSDNDGDTWTQIPSTICGKGVYDHQKLAGGRPGPVANPKAGTNHASVLYMCYNAVAQTNCAVSYDGGVQWEEDVLNDPQGATPSCGSAQSGHPVIGPDGTVAFGRAWACRQPYLYVSKDSGATWTIATVTGAGEPINQGATYGMNPEVAFTRDGTLYYNFHGPDQRQYLLRSRDLGTTWAGPWDVTPPNVNSTVFGAMVAGQDGRVAIAFLGTTAEGHSTTMRADARWHLHIVTTEDANATEPRFTSYQATPNDDPVQIGPIWQGGGNDPSRNLLDFIDAAASPNGTLHVAFADGCTTNCAKNPQATQQQSRNAELTVATLRGWNLGQRP